MKTSLLTPPYPLKPKPERQNRKCTICCRDEVGDEPHYLLYCSNLSIVETRTNFLTNIRKNVKQFGKFNDENIIDYCMLMSDSSIQEYMAHYVKILIQTYKEELGEKPSPPVITRSGRMVKKPIRLDL